MKVTALPSVLAYIEDLIPILYEKGYFGFEDTARKYVKELYNDIELNLPIYPKRPAPKYFNKYGKRDIMLCPEETKQGDKTYFKDMASPKSHKSRVNEFLSVTVSK